MGGDIEKEAGSYVLRNYGEFFKKQYQDLLLLTNRDSWEENKSYIPIQLFMENSENILITELVSSDNILMTKVLGVLTSLCVEVMKLKKEATEKYFPFLAVYEEYYDSNISMQIETICSLNSFCMRCEDTLRNLCSQIIAVVADGVVSQNGIQLHYVINHIGELFTTIVLLETLISNTSLPKKWVTFCKNLKMNSTETPEILELNEDNLKALLVATNFITNKIMNDDIVQNCLQTLLQLRKKIVDKNILNVSDDFSNYLKLAILNLGKISQSKPNVTNMYRCIKINCLFVLSSHLFGNTDRKLFKLLMELNIKANSIYITGTAVWFPEQFLQRHLPALCASHGNIPQLMSKSRQAYIAVKKGNLSKDISYYQSICTQWALTVEEIFSSRHNKLNASEMNQHAKVLLQGLDLASEVSFSILILINLHLTLGIPLPRSILMSVFEITDTLKSMLNVVQRNHSQIINSINMIIQHLIFQVIASLQEVKKVLMTDKSYANKRLDELTCVVITEHALKGPTIIERYVAANIALGFIPEKIFLDDGYARLSILMEKVQALMYFYNTFESYCNCSWMLWHQNIIPIYFEHNFNIKLNALKMKYFLKVLEDCSIILHKTDVMYYSEKSQDFVNGLIKLLNEQIIRTAGQNIETNLRLHIHSHLQLDVVNPFNSETTKKMLLAINTLRLRNTYMCIIPSVEHYLSNMYYNLTTVVLSDWKTYGEMRQMARFKFNLNTVHDNLPTQTLEQGLDVLEIMRNIHTFVSKYHYNLNNQIFVEKGSNNKHLNSINIGHVANSIRTHGTGIMNTTVNFTYQFLKKKFFTFSQFMYDEHIKSRLSKDLRSFTENYVSNGQMYLYKNAEKFNKGIRSLGVVENDQSYLDLFRDLITQIGNAMGYVRMIRSGGRHCCSDATVFLENIDTIVSCKDMCETDKLELNCINASVNVDNTINQLVQNFLQGTEYFKLLVDVFAPVFHNPKNIHLKNFFIIVPPLTLNFVEHMILSKDKMTKKNKAGAAFTDDGFAMGVAYILKLLDQDSDFEILHWFDAVWKHIHTESKLIEEQKRNGSTQLQQALALTEKKLKVLEDEFKLLYYSLTSARIFFR